MNTFKFFFFFFSHKNIALHLFFAHRTLTNCDSVEGLANTASSASCILAQLLDNHVPTALVLDKAFIHGAVCSGHASAQVDRVAGWGGGAVLDGVPPARKVLAARPCLGDTILRAGAVAALQVSEGGVASVWIHSALNPPANLIGGVVAAGRGRGVDIAL